MRNVLARDRAGSVGVVRLAMLATSGRQIMPVKKNAIAGRLGLAFVVLVASLSHADSDVDLSPANWGEGEVEKYLALEGVLNEDKPVTEGSSGLIAGSSSTLAMRAGLEALKQGGTAADAALTGALAQIVMNAGATVSYAGVLELVYYDAETGKVYALDAGFDTVLAEDDPLTIPRLRPGPEATPEPRGRTVLVPGFMAGVEAAHERFGVLLFEQIFQPAIYFAEEGIPVTPRLGRWLGFRQEILSRLPATKAVFTREDGEFIQEGDVLQQVALAETLRAVAREGAAYMYEGPWAEAFVTAVQADGGKLTMDDLAAYQPTWSKPLHVTYHGHDVYSIPDALALAGALNLLEAGEVASMGHYRDSPHALYWLLRILREVRFQPEHGFLILGSDRSVWRDKSFAAGIWEAWQAEPEPASSATGEPGPGHSSSIVAVDKDGNVAALLHSINTSVWGESGLIIGGVSIPDAAAFQQGTINHIGPGRRLPTQIEPVIVLRGGKPILATSAIGSAIDYDTARVLYSALDFAMDPKEALDAPGLLGAIDEHERVMEGEFPEAFVEAVRALGMDLEVVEPRLAGRYRGSGVLLRIDPESGRLLGAASAYPNGGALAY
ncbi:MAG: gamma-glutamyltransferase [Phycisphaerales bacterium JB038]